MNLISANAELADSPTMSTRSVPTGEVRWTWFDASQRVQVMRIWHAIQAEHANLSLFATTEWTESWLKQFGDVVPHRFATMQIGQEYVGVILLTRGVADYDGWFSERAWHWGTAGEPESDSAFIEYNSLACHPAFVSQFTHELLVQLSAESDWDAIKLDGFVHADLPPEIHQAEGWQFNTKSARWLDLNHVRATGSDLMYELGDSTRKNIRQSMRKLGDIRFECSTSADHAHNIFDDLIRLHQARWQAVGQPGCYASERFTQFHRTLIDRLVPQQRMLLVRVSNNHEVLGCSQLLIDRNRALVYQGGRVPESNGSPGLVTDFLSMQECLARGYDAFDFMAGDSIHKRRLTNSVTTLSWGTWRRPRWKYQVMAKIRQWRSKASKWHTSGQKTSTAAKQSSTKFHQHPAGES